MDLMTWVLIGAAVLFGALWMMRRRSRMGSDKFD
jgi:hypothetical protein